MATGPQNGTGCALKGSSAFFDGGSGGGGGGFLGGGFLGGDFFLGGGLKGKSGAGLKGMKTWFFDTGDGH